MDIDNIISANNFHPLLSTAGGDLIMTWGGLADTLHIAPKENSPIFGEFGYVSRLLLRRDLLCERNRRFFLYRQPKYFCSCQKSNYRF